MNSGPPTGDEMGSRGYNAGGFAYMETVTCPECGARRKLGRESREQGMLTCNDRLKCAKRRSKGHFLYRLNPPNG